MPGMTTSVIRMSMRCSDCRIFRPAADAARNETVYEPAATTPPATLEGFEEMGASHWPFAAHTGRPVFVDNDAKALALGEVVFCASTSPAIPSLPTAPSSAG